MKHDAIARAPRRPAEPVRQAGARQTAAWLLFGLAWLASSGFVLLRLPRVPALINDSAGYIQFAPTRGPGYPLLLRAFQAVTGDASFAWLPQLQTLLIAVALLAFAWQVARLLASPLAGAAVVVLAWMHTATYDATRSLASEGLFLPLTLAGLAGAIAYARRGRAGALGFATACFTLALLTRTAGAALLLLPVLLVLLDGRLPLGAAARQLGLAGVITTGLTLSGMAVQAANSGHFAIGSNSGTSLLGKGLLLLRPAPGQDPVLAAMAPLAAEAREAVAAAPNFAASLRAQAQAYEELRWPSFFPLAEANWPEVREDPWWNANQTAKRIARTIIAADLPGYARLVARDWLGLVLYPHLWPVAWTPASSPHPFFAHCVTDRKRCWTFFRLEIPRAYSVTMLGTSLLGLAATLVLLIGWGRRALRRALAPAERVMLAMAVVAQTSLLATALFEAGLWRYMLAIHLLHAALLAWLGVTALHLAGRRAMDHQAVEGRLTYNS